MESNNFISLSREKDKKLLFGIKMVPDKAMDRLTDNLVIYIEKRVNHWDRYYLAFRKKCSNSILTNSYLLTKKALKSYIDFLQNFYDNFDLAKEVTCPEFRFDSSGYVSLKVLHSNFLKVSSVKTDAAPVMNLFFVLNKNELISYINKMKSIYTGKEIDTYFNLSFSNMCDLKTHTLTKREKDSLYINTLYLLADNSLDLKDKKAFNVISKEILKVIDTSSQ